jgi:hypothetical protein
MSGSDDLLHGRDDVRLKNVFETFETLASHVTQTTILRDELKRRGLI